MNMTASGRVFKQELNILPYSIAELVLGAQYNSKDLAPYSIPKSVKKISITIKGWSDRMKQLEFNRNEILIHYQYDSF